jgi:type II secretory pathway component PulF
MGAGVGALTVPVLLLLAAAVVVSALLVVVVPVEDEAGLTTVTPATSALEAGLPAAAVACCRYC